METLQELLIAEIQDLYSAEKQLVKALPKMVKGAKSPELKKAISAHLEETKNQVARLEQVFSAVGAKAKAKHCKGMEGLLAEGAECLAEESAGLLRDLQLIGAAQRVEHYEIAAYGTARMIAEQLNNQEAAGLLDDTLSEEEEADSKLSEVAATLYAMLEDEKSDPEQESMSRPAKQSRQAAAR